MCTQFPLHEQLMKLVGKLTVIYHQYIKGSTLAVGTYLCPLWYGLVTASLLVLPTAPTDGNAYSENKHTQSGRPAYVLKGVRLCDFQVVILCVKSGNKHTGYNESSPLVIRV